MRGVRRTAPLLIAALALARIGTASAEEGGGGGGGSAGVTCDGDVCTLDDAPDPPDFLVLDVNEGALRARTRIMRARGTLAHTRVCAHAHRRRRGGR